MDVTRDDHVQHAIDYVIENLPAGEQGRTLNQNKNGFRQVSRLFFKYGWQQVAYILAYYNLH